MKTINRDQTQVVKDMPQSDITLDVATVDDRKFYSYSLNFIIDQVAAYTSDVRTMQVDVAYKNVGKTFTLLSGKNFSNFSEINKQLLSVNKKRRDFITQKDAEQKANNILEKKVDIFAKTPKISLYRLRQTNFIDLTTIVTNYVSNSTNSTVNDLLRTPLQEMSSDTGESLYSNLTLRGRDPAEKIAPEQIIQDGPRVRSGLLTTSRMTQTIAGSFTTRQIGAIENNNLPRALRSRAIQTTTADVKLPYKFQIPVSSKPPNGKFTIICTLRSSNGDLVQKADFIINHAREERQYSIPRILPTTFISPINSTEACINVFNKDPRVSSIRLYARDIPSHQTISDQARFTKTQDITADWQQRTIKQKFLFKSGTSKLVRALPVLTNGLVLGNFKSTSIPKPKSTVAGSVIAFSDKNVVTVNAYDTPTSYSYVQFVRRNLSKKQKSWDEIQDPIKVGLGIATITDTEIRPGVAYEYGVILQDKYGNKAQAKGTSIVIVQDYTAGTELSVSIKTSTVNNSEITTTFNVGVRLSKDGDRTGLLEATKAQGINDFFASETKQLSGDLNSITKVNIKRISRDTGEVKDLGVVEPGDFTDTTTENVVYIFEGLLRSQADLFEETGAKKVAPKVLNPRDALQRGNIVSSALTNTNKISNVNFTQKFLSKKSLLRGTLSYGITKVMDDEESGFLQGKLGITNVVSITKPRLDYSIGNFDLIICDPGRRLLSFDVQNRGPQKSIDFFIVSTLRGGIKSVVGSCHYIDDSTRQHFLDDKTYLTTGNVSYVITPVGYDGVTGSEVTSQQFEVI